MATPVAAAVIRMLNCNLLKQRDTQTKSPPFIMKGIEVIADISRGKIRQWAAPNTL